MNLGTVLLLHNRVANAAWLYMAIIGLWSLVNYARGRGLDGNILGAIVVGELMMLVQAALGITLLVSGFYPPRVIHFLYGSLSVLVFPALWAYTRGDTSRQASLLWGLAGLAMMGLAFRAIGTGS
uniref:Hypothetical conserved protein n=1 Tax=uncultured Chloroflexota bacterium TaxID=166587 RepID=H5SPD6_9CHLR|nr:hypothetical conserved protein [uncultured Chloroflexota bacterium]